MTLATGDNAAVVHSTGEVHRDERAHILGLGNRFHNEDPKFTTEVCWPRWWPKYKRSVMEGRGDTCGCVQ